MPKISKPKSLSSNNLTEPLSARVTSNAWVSIEEPEKMEPTKSKFLKRFSKNKKNLPEVEVIEQSELKKPVILMNGFEKPSSDYVSYSAEHNSVHEKRINGGLRKTSSAIETLKLSDSENGDSIIVYPVGLAVNELFGDIRSSQNMETSEEESVHSTESSNQKQNNGKKTKSKIRVKKTKSRQTKSEIIYLKCDQFSNKNLGCKDFPWLPVTYDPEIHKDKITAKDISIFHLVNIMGNRRISGKVLIDMRRYDEFESKTILGAKHFSDFQDKKCSFKLEYVRKRNFTLVILMNSDEFESIQESSDKMTIFRLNKGIHRIQKIFPELLVLPMTDNNFWPSVTLFDLGTIILADDLDTSLKCLGMFPIDLVVTDKRDAIYRKLSDTKHSPIEIIPVDPNDVINGSYSEKTVTDSKLMSMLEEIFNSFQSKSRIMVLIFDEHCSLVVLLLILMFKNHWTVHDGLACVKYVRCEDVTLKQNQLNILKNFEKLFFGKRLSSANNKTKLVEEYAIRI